MATNATTQHRAPWERAITNHQNLSRQLIEVQPQDRDALERAIIEQEEELLGMPAPGLPAVIRKLEMLWSEKLHGLDQASDERRLILEDLEGLVSVSSDLFDATA